MLTDKDTHLWTRIDRETGEKGAINEQELRSALRPYYHNLVMCLKELATGNELDTPFAIYRQEYGHREIMAKHYDR